MAFSRDDLAAYESQPQVQVPDPIIAKAPTALESEPPQTESAESTESSSVEESGQPAAGDDVTSGEEDAGSPTAAADDSGETAEGETEGVEGDPAEGETESTGQPPQKQSRAFKRIQELNAKALEASDLAEGYKEFGKLAAEQAKALREENERLRAQLTSTKPAPAAEAPKLGPMPKLTDPDVNFDPDILAQKQEEWFDRKLKLAITPTQPAAPSPVQVAVEAFKSRVETLRAETPDWDAKVKNPDLPPLNAAAQSVVVKADNGPAIVYHLASNIAEAKRIAALPPEDQVFEIGVIKARLDAQAKAKPSTSADTPAKTPVTAAKVVVKKSVSQAPPPPTRVPAGNRSQERNLTDPSLDMEEFARRHRESRHSARLASRKMRGLN